MSGIRNAGGDISRIIVGGVEAERVVVAGVDVWRRKYRWFDDFSSYPVGALSTPNYEVYTSGGVTPKVNSSGQLVVDSGSGTVIAGLRHVNPVKTDNMRVSGRVSVRAVNATDFQLLLGASETMNGYSGVNFHTDANARGIYTHGTRRVGLSANPALNDVVAMEQVVSGGSCTYTCRNLTTGAVLGTWTDTSGAVSRGPAYRWGGMALSRKDGGIFGSTVYSPGWDDFVFEDI